MAACLCTDGPVVHGRKTKLVNPACPKHGTPDNPQPSGAFPKPAKPEKKEDDE